MEFKKIQINGLEIRYAELNKDARQCLVFLPGWGGNLESWKDFLRTFEAETVRILAFDLPGFGQSQTPPRPWTVADYANLLKNFLDQLGLSKIYLFGHSFGGQIAVRFAYDHPERLAKLFLSGAAVIRPKKTSFKIIMAFWAKIFKILLLGKGAGLRRLIYRVIGGVDYGNLTEPVMRQTMAKVIADDLSSLLPDIKLPTVIIWGKNDTKTPFEHFLQIKKLMPKAKTFVFEDASHGLHLQKPKELKQIVMDNLN